MNLAEISALTEDEARDYLESIRWPQGPACPRCGDMAVTKLQGKSTRPGVYKCKGCRKPFTVTVGTIFERSHIKLRLWLMAFHLICSSKKGISALQLQRNLALKSYKSAWFMAHRIRYAMRQEPLRGMLKGDVEADETYIGGEAPSAEPEQEDQEVPKEGRGGARGVSEARRSRSRWSMSAKNLLRPALKLLVDLKAHDRRGQGVRAHGVTTSRVVTTRSSTRRSSTSAGSPLEHGRELLRTHGVWGHGGVPPRLLEGHCPGRAERGTRLPARGERRGSPSGP